VAFSVRNRIGFLYIVGLPLLIRLLLPLLFPPRRSQSHHVGLVRPCSFGAGIIQVRSAECTGSPSAALFWVSSRKNRITGKVSVLPLKNSLWEVKETVVAHILLDADLFQGQRGAGDVLGQGLPGFDRKGRNADGMIHGKARVLPVDETGGQMGVDELFPQK